MFSYASGIEAKNIFEHLALNGSLLIDWIILILHKKLTDFNLIQIESTEIKNVFANRDVMKILLTT